ncbi:MAG: hypothetical protein M9939_26465 [Mesorhizobium sp.]|nr:hypothetical protein [Mesorhizobium sp.]MCO5085109.1 hypothetical protein [Rhizobiaceae bacterium]MCO5164637.1 hypothetical protein [Mesorhizobium sp.]
MGTFRKGDRVSVMGTVRHDQRGDAQVFLDIDGYYSPVSVGAEEVTLVYPRLDPGDRVRWTNGVVAQVIAAADGFLWVKSDKGERWTWPATEVSFVVPAPPIEPPASLPAIEHLPETQEVEF